MSGSTYITVDQAADLSDAIAKSRATAAERLGGPDHLECTTANAVNGGKFGLTWTRNPPPPPPPAAPEAQPDPAPDTPPAPAEGGPG